MGEKTFLPNIDAVLNILSESAVAYWHKWAPTCNEKVPEHITGGEAALLLADECSDEDKFWIEKSIEVIDVIDALQEHVFQIHNTGLNACPDPDKFLIDNLPDYSFIVLSEGLEIIKTLFDAEKRGITTKVIKKFHKKLKYRLTSPEDDDVRDWLSIIEVERFIHGPLLGRDNQQKTEPIKRPDMKGLKKPKGRRGWVCEQIAKMDQSNRTQFLSLHSGEQQFYDLLYTGIDSWLARYKKSYPDDDRSQFQSAVEKGKQLCKKTPQVLNFFNKN
ncbi:MAG: hypothetical protein WCK32_09180 [Chlorobiaceae bacterium]